MRAVCLRKDPHYGFGMVVTCGSTHDTLLYGAFVESVFPGSPADLSGSISPGDQIMSVNGRDVRKDHFLTVVELLQCSASPVDLILSKSSNLNTDITKNFTKDILERPFMKNAPWVFKSCKEIDVETLEADSLTSKTIVISPPPKWLDTPPPLLDAPDLTHNHSSEHGRNPLPSLRSSDIPDIIASQVCRRERSSSSPGAEELHNGEEEPFGELLPGEVFHVVLDKRGGSLGLNIYQGTESGGSEQRYIYVHSAVPNGAADLDGRIKEGDKLLEVNGDSLENLSYQEVVTKLRESPQVTHLVLQKGCSDVKDVPKKRPKKPKTLKLGNIYQPQEHREENDSPEATYSSLPMTSTEMDSVCYSAKDASSVPSSPTTKTPNGKFPKPLTSYSSTPNLADNSDEEDKVDKGYMLYRYRSTECLVTPHFLRPHQALVDFRKNHYYFRGSASNLNQIPAVPIRKKKLRKLEDIYNYSNSENTFEVSICKSSRGLGLCIFGGTDVQDRDIFSKLIRIRKLYPLQPALECGKLAPGDVILEVNGTKMVGLKNAEALEVLRCAPINVVLTVFRPSKSLIPSFSTFKGEVWPFLESSSSSASSSLTRTQPSSYEIEIGEFEVTLVKEGGGLGFTISKSDVLPDPSQCGFYVKSLVREPAISNGKIHAGDKILLVNGTDISNMSHAEAIQFMRETPNSVILKLHRLEPPLTPGEELQTTPKPLRWEALELLSDRKTKDAEEPSNPKRKIKRKLERSGNNSSSTESGSSGSSSLLWERIGEEHSESIENLDFSKNSHSDSKYNFPRIFRAEDEAVGGNVASLKSEGYFSNFSSEYSPIVTDTILEESLNGLDSIDYVDANHCPKLHPKQSEASAKSEMSSNFSPNQKTLNSLTENSMNGTSDCVDNIGMCRNQRPKSLDVLNSSNHKRGPTFNEESNFHRQASVMNSEVDDGQAPSGGTEKNLLKWRGRTLDCKGQDEDSENRLLMENQGDLNESGNSEDFNTLERKPVPFPRTTSCSSSEALHTVFVELDRGWHGRLGFSLVDPPPSSPNSRLPNAVAVKCVFPGSLADRDGRIQARDRLVEVNKECLLSLSAAEVIDRLRKTRGLIRMVFHRPDTKV